MLRRTPCIGICSTTYGDLVCRGCKRFAHEIVQWNAFEHDQRQAVWQRLLTLRAGAVRTVLVVTDPARLSDQAARLGMAVEEHVDSEHLLYELLQRLQWRDTHPPLTELGVTVAAGAADSTGAPVEPVPEALLAAIDREFYRRSLAQYERNYRIPAQ